MAAGGVVQGPRSVNYRQRGDSRDDADNYTFTGVSIGDASPERIVVVAVYGRRTSGETNWGTITIGGVASTVIWNRGSSTFPHALVSSVVPTGMTASINILSTPNILHTVAYAVWTVYGATNPTPYQTENTNDLDVGVDIDVPTEGVLIASAWNNSTATAIYGVTQRYGLQVASSTSSIFMRGGDETLALGATSRNVYVDTTGGGTLVAASW